MTQNIIGIIADTEAENLYGVYVRSGPYREAKSVGNLSPGIVVVVLGQEANGMLRVITQQPPTIEGWVPARSVTLDPDDFPIDGVRPARAFELAVMAEKAPLTNEEWRRGRCAWCGSVIEKGKGVDVGESCWIHDACQEPYRKMMQGR